MKKVMLFAAMAVSLMLSSCKKDLFVYVSLSGENTTSYIDNQTGYTKVDVGEGIFVNFKQGIDNIKITTDKNVLKYVNIETYGGTMHVAYSSIMTFSSFDSQGITVVDVPFTTALNTVTANGKSRVTINGDLEELTIKASNERTQVLPIGKYTKVNITVSDLAEVGDYRGEFKVSQELTVTGTGTSNIWVSSASSALMMKGSLSDYSTLHLVNGYAIDRVETDETSEVIKSIY